MPVPAPRGPGGVRPDVPVRADRRAQALDGLRPGLLVAAAAIIGSLPVHLVQGPGRASTPLAVFAGVVALLLLGAWAGLRQPVVRAAAERHAHEVVVAVAALASLVPAVELVVFPLPASAGGILVVLLAAGTLVHHRQQAVGLTAALVLLTVVVGAGQGFRDGWGPVTAIVVAAWVLAHVLQVMRYRAADALACTEAALLEAAVTDDMTGVANRRGLLEAGAAALAEARGTPTSVLYLDVDGLKRTNDRFGHAAGDRLVRAAAAAMVAAVSGHDVVARLGGDEFAVLMPGTGAEAAEAARARLQDTLAQAGVQASVGSATACPHVGRPPTGADVVALLDRADADMYATRQQRRAFPVPAPAAPRPASRQDRHVDRRDHRAATERLLGAPDEAATTGRDLRDLALAGLWLHLAVAPAHLLLLPSGPDRVMAVASVGAGALFGLLLLPSLRASVTPRAGGLLCAGLVLLSTETVGYAALVGRPWASLATVLAVVGVGGALRRTRQVVLLTVLTAAGWTAVAVWRGLGPDAAWYVVSMGCGIAVGVLLHVSHRSTLARLRAAEARVRSVAFTDELTGLPNRRSFLQQGRPVVESSLRDGGQASVLFLDLDGLKEVNDRDGHAAGDRLLATAADALRRSVGPGDLVARLGGDEFTALVLGDPSSQVPARLARVQAAFAEHGISASTGVAHLPRDARTLDSLVDRADEAMLRVKHERRRARAEGLPAAVSPSPRQG